jgi:hypothetical protein
MSDRVPGRQVGKVAAVPKPPGFRPRPAVVPAQRAVVQRDAKIQPEPAPIKPGSGAVPLQRPATCRATVREALDVALRGIKLSGRDRQFLSRLVHWDKRNAAAVASLLTRARLAGREEVALSPRQMEIVLTALEDAAVYRASGADVMGCWDCENIPGGRCADHARDAERARACAELAAQLAAGSSAAAAAGELKRLTSIAGFRRRTSVAS